MFQELEQNVVLMQVLIQAEFFEIGVDEVAEKEEQLKGDALLEVLVQMREVDDLLTRPQVADDFLVFFLLDPGHILILVFELLGFFQELENHIAEVVLLLHRFLIEDKVIFVARRLVVREEIQNLVQTIGSHGSILLSILNRNELLDEFVAPELVVGLEPLEDGIKVAIQQDELLEHIFRVKDVNQDGAQLEVECLLESFGLRCKTHDMICGKIEIKNILYNV